MVSEYEHLYVCSLQVSQYKNKDVSFLHSTVMPHTQQKSDNSFTVVCLSLSCGSNISAFPE